jgi:hypothetical protein
MNDIRISGGPLLRRRGKIVLMTVALILPCLGLRETPLRSQTAVTADFNRFLQTVESIYCRPNGLTLAGLRSNMPTLMSWFIGHAVRQQIPFVNQNPNLRPLFDSLQTQIQHFLGESVRLYGNSPAYNPPQGTGIPPITPESLWTGVVMGMQGLWDDKIWTDYHVPLGSMPAALSPLAPPADPQELVMKRPSVKLLGKKPNGPVQSTQTTGSGGQIGAGPPPRALNPDNILGEWFGIDRGNGSAHLHIDKQGDQYVGRIVGQGGFLEFRWERDDVCFMVKFAGQGTVEGSMGKPCLNFNGRQYVQEGMIGSSYAWKDDYGFQYTVDSDGTEHLGNWAVNGFQRQPFRYK